MDKALRKKCLKFINPDESDVSMYDPFMYDSRYMGCHLCKFVEECKKGDLADGQKTTRETVPKRKTVPKTPWDISGPYC